MIALVRLVDHLLLTLFSLSILAISGQDMSKKKEKLCAKNLENLKNIPGVTKPGSSGNQALHLRST